MNLPKMPKSTTIISVNNLIKKNGPVKSVKISNLKKHAFNPNDLGCTTDICGFFFNSFNSD